MAASEDLLALARREIGTKEQPAGSNRVKYNTEYYGWEVSGRAYPWCCVFLWWLFRMCGASALFYGGARTASCGTLMDYARRNGLLVTKDYRPGDLVFFRAAWSPWIASHVGIYAGNGQFIHSPNSRSVVSYADLYSDYYTNHYYSARRICGN